MRTPKHLVDRNLARKAIGGPSKPPPRPPIERTVFLERSISLWGWPSRGGLIVLESAGPVDFDYLGLDRFQPLAQRSSNQDDEDAFCQKLLQLGARWFDSSERYGFVANVDREYEREVQAVEDGTQPAPSDVERRWVSVGVEEGGGFWVLEYDRIMYYARETRNLVPSDASRVMLAVTMQERCEILKDMGAIFYQEVSEYSGLACINAWETGVGGERGALEHS
ncbi:hypothetical protein MBLNU13_g04129t1 [Cladosporium sp. NU13]